MGYCLSFIHPSILFCLVKTRWQGAAAQEEMSKPISPQLVSGRMRPKQPQLPPFDMVEQHLYYSCLPTVFNEPIHPFQE